MKFLKPREDFCPCKCVCFKSVPLSLLLTEECTGVFSHTWYLFDWGAPWDCV